MVFLTQPQVSVTNGCYEYVPCTLCSWYTNPTGGGGCPDVYIAYPY